MTITIRPAQADDHDALFELMKRASLANDDDREMLLANPDAFELPREQLCADNAAVAMLDGKPVGFVTVIRRPDGDAELDGLFVEPDYWRRGVGRKLMEAARGLSMGLGARVLHVTANPHARAFYLAAGFEPLGTVRLQFGSGTLMQLKI